ncbi:MAG TPA: sensor domain-containing diguanylate cyclase [Candidatus Limnocylindrales bacterium]|nr:sensor domain-containing diguanylate cyclase [Candidatus Limnocylindrales bacterium]
MNARVDFVTDFPLPSVRPTLAEYRPVAQLASTEHAGSRESSSAPATDADARHLRKLLNRVGIVAVGLGIALGYLFLHNAMQRPDQLLSAVGLVLLGLGMIVGRLFVDRGNVLRSAVWLSAAILTFVVVVSLAGQANPALALTTLVAVLVAVPYVDRSTLLGVSVAGWLVATFVGLSSVLGGDRSALSEILVRVVGVSLQTGIALAVVYHLSGRLTGAAQRYRDLFQRVPVGMYRTTPDGRFLDVNRAFIQMFGYQSGDELTAIDATALYADPADRVGFQSAVGQAGFVRSIEYRARRVDGRVFWVRDSARLVRDANDQPVYYEGIVEDVTERKQHELQLEHRATIDALTGLANRTVLLEMLEQALGGASSDRPVALLFVDLDDFKLVNDRHGHAVGDAVLAEVGRRLRQATREADTIARFGGDEFAVLLEVPTSDAAAQAVAERVVAEFSRPFQIAGQPSRLGASVGVAIARRPLSPPELLNRADAAMYGAKRRSKISSDPA